MSRTGYGMLLSLLVLVIVNCASAVQVMKPNYLVQEYASYKTYYRGLPSGMAFDNNGNLYVSHTNGYIEKIDNQGAATVLVNNLGKARDLVWTGGSNYGDSLYTANEDNNRIIKVNLDGTSSTFANWGTVTAVGFSDNTSYGKGLYAGASVGDSLRKFNTNGSSSLFSSFPYNMSGSVNDINFAPDSFLNGACFAGTYSLVTPQYAGLFKIKNDGSASRFTNELICCTKIDFDESGVLSKNMFAAGLVSSDVQNWSLFEVDENGNTQLFAKIASGQFSFECGNDGALYIAENDATTGMTVISQISMVPEPATLLMMTSGIWFLFKRK